MRRTCEISKKPGLGFLGAVHVSEREVCKEVFKKTQKKQRPWKNDCLHGDVVLSILLRRTAKQALKGRQQALKVTRHRGASTQGNEATRRRERFKSEVQIRRNLRLVHCLHAQGISADRQTDIPTKVWELFGEITAANWGKKYS